MAARSEAMGFIGELATVNHETLGDQQSLRIRFVGQPWKRARHPRFIPDQGRLRDWKLADSDATPPGCKFVKTPASVILAPG